MRERGANRLVAIKQRALLIRTRALRLSICDDNIVDDNASVRLSSASLMDRKKCYFSCYFSFFHFFFIFYFYEHGVVPSM